MPKPICIYHANCTDGFAAACVVNYALDGDVELHPAQYGDSPPDVQGRKVIIVDFSYKRPVMQDIIDKAASVVVLDHHQSAEKELQGLEFPPNKRVRVEFDMNACGAVLAWRRYFSAAPVPMLLRHIQDRDLWQFKLLDTEAVIAALRSYPMNVDLWTDFILDDDAIKDLVIEGEAINRKFKMDLEHLLDNHVYPAELAGYTVPVLNAPPMFASEAGNRMAKDERFADTPFAVVYCDLPDKRIFSLRSAEHGIDVSEIAERFGGGGHKHAAGFTTERGGWPEED